MKSILQKLYGGEICPDELIVPRDPKYYSLNKKISEQREYFKHKLSTDDFQKLEELDSLYNQIGSMTAEASFIYGFKLSAMLMTEIFIEKDELVRNNSK